MNINEYINWGLIWADEICLDTDEFENEEQLKINQFNLDTSLELDNEECEMQDDGNMIFVWSVNGGQNESDTQGWYRMWWLEFNSECQLVSINYEQG